MARGWESKSVEEQQAEFKVKSVGNKKISPEAAARLRQRETLRLARQRVLQLLARSSNPRHRELLQNELADLDQKLSNIEA